MEWPKDGKCADFLSIADPIRKAFKTFVPKINWEKAGQNTEHKWSGLSFETGVAHILPQPEDLLSRDGLDHAFDQGRDVLDQLLLIAINLGFEQGRRYQEQDTKPMRELLAMVKKSNAEFKKNLESAANKNSSRKIRPKKAATTKGEKK